MYRILLCSFLLWDGYGMMPSLCGVQRPVKATSEEPGLAESAPPMMCVASYGSVLDMIRKSKER